MEATNDTVVMIQRDHCTREMNLSMLNAQSIFNGRVRRRAIFKSVQGGKLVAGNTLSSHGVNDRELAGICHYRTAKDYRCHHYTCTRIHARLSVTCMKSMHARSYSVPAIKQL
jgi:hypothetical protein